MNRTSREFPFHIFEDNSVLTDTLMQMGVTENIDSIEFCKLQAGALALHYLFSVAIGEEKYYFVMYAARTPETHNVGRVARADYEALGELHLRFSRLSTTVNKAVSVVRPFAFGLAQHRGLRYQVFSTEYIDRGELHVDFDKFAETRSHVIGYPVYYYALTNDAQMERENELLIRLVDSLKDQSLRNSSGSIEELERRWNATPNAKILINQQRAVLWANAVLYAAAGSLYPVKQSLNAGDWMCRIDNYKPHRFVLISSPLGLRQLSEDEWVRLMVSQSEPDKTGTFFHPFMHLSKKDITAILQDAKEFVQH